MVYLYAKFETSYNYRKIKRVLLHCDQFVIKLVVFLQKKLSPFEILTPSQFSDFEKGYGHQKYCNQVKLNHG